MMEKSNKVYYILFLVVGIEIIIFLVAYFTTLNSIWFGIGFTCTILFGVFILLYSMQNNHSDELTGYDINNSTLKEKRDKSKKVREQKNKNSKNNSLSSKVIDKERELKSEFDKSKIIDFVEDEMEKIRNQTYKQNWNKIRNDFKNEIEKIRSQIRDKSRKNKEIILNNEIIKKYFGEIKSKIDSFNTRIVTIEHLFQELEGQIKNQDNKEIKKILQNTEDKLLSKITELKKNLNEKLELDIERIAKKKSRIEGQQKEEKEKKEEKGIIKVKKQPKETQDQKIKEKRKPKRKPIKKKEEIPQKQNLEKKKDKNKVYLINRKINVVEVEDFPSKLEFKGTHFKIQKTMNANSLDGFKAISDRIKRFFKNREFILA
ncbi:MAG: hypothetical protein GF311_23010, partial [Candidatus Lokiarchaeota archaeon]|nr:hypothetical protein [Candidatus Lokiarchaeota archaeon]